jgi:hypothetical protein
MTKPLINLATILFPTFFVTLSLMLAASMQTIEGSLDIQRNETETETGTPNATSYGSDEDGDTQNCQMPPCPPGEMCIQVCPESEPKY